MAEEIHFSKGQRLTAASLNKIQANAKQGIESGSIYTNGKIINLPSTVDARQIYSAPRFLDTRYFKTIYKWPGEQNVNQHLYICLMDSEVQAIKSQGTYFTWDNHHSRFVLAYFRKNDSLIRLVSRQDLDINTDLETRKMDSFLSGYVPHTNYTGFVETPIPPDTDVHLSRMGLYDENNNRVGTVFVIWGKEDGSLLNDNDMNELLSHIYSDNVWGDNLNALIPEGSITIISNLPDMPTSKILNHYQNICGSYTLDHTTYEPWQVLNDGEIASPIFQIGCEQFICGAYEDQDYNIHQLSSDQRLSARLGSNLCIIDVPRLSAYHTWMAPDHPLSASPNFNPAFQVPIAVFAQIPIPNEDGTVPEIGLNYLNRNPIVPCWQVYPF